MIKNMAYNIIVLKLMSALGRGILIYSLYSQELRQTTVNYIIKTSTEYS